VKKAMFAAMIAILAVGSANAEVLLDQSDYDPWVPGFFNSESGSPPFGLTQYAVNDVTVDEAGWHVHSISLYFGAADPAWGDGIFEGRLHVFDKSGPLPMNGFDDPTISPIVPMTATLEGDHFVVTAWELGLDLLPGEYWIGITPNAPSGFFGPEPQLAAMTLIGDATASLDPFPFPPGPLMWFNFNPGVDAAMTIDGTAFPGCDEGDDEVGDDEGVDEPDVFRTPRIGEESIGVKRTFGAR